MIRQHSATGNRVIVSAQQRRERNLMIQFLFVIIIMLAYETCFFTLKDKELGTIAINIFAILNSSVSPVTAFIFAQDVNSLLLNRIRIPQPIAQMLHEH